ncbi:MAG: MotA/TolQ/ExbB proton channel family protein [Verrucomicrobiota bacterium]|jgi:biopolymer transport protein ExbB|nr:MotA/TolQ/ExbB proton channel family protein [Verrucomicrobiota bacterium]
MKKIIAILVLFALLLPLSALAQEAPPPNPPANAAGEVAAQRQTLWDIIKTGGWAMWPLGLCSIALVTMCILNMRMVSRKNLIPAGVILPIRAAAAQRDIGQVYALAKAAPNLFTRGLIPGLRKLNTEDPVASKPDMEGAIAEAVSREEAQVGFWINFLSLITGIAPMIGLLGTVSGMIGAFQKIGMGGMGKPELLAANIGEALITTATGLIIAIPAMVAYFIFRNNLSRIVRDAEGEYSAILDSITGTGSIFAEVDQEIADEGTQPA